MAEKEADPSDDCKYDITCTPCWVDGNREEAVKYCPECQEYLCATCIKYHRRMAATKEHELIDKNETRQRPDTSTTAKCVQHPDRDVEMYCGTHDMVYCLKCITNDHWSCSGHICIDDVSTTQLEYEMQILQDEMTNFTDRLENAKIEGQKDIDTTEKRRQELTHNIQELENDLVEHIANLKSQATETLNKRCSDVHNELELDSTVIQSTIGEVENLRKKLETAVNMDTDQQFALTKLVQNSVNKAKSVYENNKLNGIETVYFKENVELHASVMQATAIGEMHVITENVSQASSRNYNVKSKIWVEVQMETDTSKCIISDICQLQDGTMILTDHGNKKVKRFNKSYEIVDQCELDAVPTGICCTGKNEVCVKKNNNKLQFISVGKELIKQRELKIQDGSYYGIAFCGGEFWVSRRNGVSVYSTSGTLIKSFEAEQGGKKIFKTDTIQHMSIRGDTVIVTDHSDGAVCLNEDGTMRREFRDERLRKAGGVCVSSDGTVFISGYRSNNILMFGRDGTCLKELVAEDAALKCPISLYYDSNKNSIIVSCENSKYIYVFELYN